LHHEEVKGDEDEQDSVDSEDDGRGEDGDEPSGEEIAHGHASTEGEVVEAHDASAHFVGGDELNERIDHGEDGHHCGSDEDQHGSAEVDDAGECEAGDSEAEQDESAESDAAFAADVAGAGDDQRTSDGADPHEREEISVGLRAAMEDVFDEYWDVSAHGHGEEGHAEGEEDERFHGGLPAREIDSLFEAGEDGFRGLGWQEARRNHAERNDGREERKSVESEAPGFAELGKGLSGERGADGNGKIELDGVQGDGVRHVFAFDERGDERLIGGSSEGLGKTGDERETKNLPDLNVVGGDQNGEDGGRGHLQILRTEKDSTALEAVGDDSADEGEEEDRDSAEELVESEKECRMAEPVDEPALRHDLHPGANAGSASTDPHEAKIAIFKCFEDPPNHPIVSMRLRARYHARE
jgi:hypothetical protein